MENMNEIATLTKKFNELNEKKPGHSTFCKIKGFEFFNPKPNGATCSIIFQECIQHKERESRFDFVDEEHLISYLKAHT